MEKKKTPYFLRIFVATYIFFNITLATLLSLSSQILAIILLFPLFFTNLRLRYVVLGAIFRFWNALLLIWLNPFWKIVVVRNPPKFYKTSKTIITVNHTSNADPWICCGSFFPWETKYVLKKDLLSLPIVGWVIQLAGDLPIRFTKEKGGWGTDPLSVENVFERTKLLQSHNIGQVVFPEGTRSANGRLKLFKNGFFQFALKNNIEILPFACNFNFPKSVIHNAREIWPVGSWLPDKGTVYVAFGNPILPEENDNVETLKKKVRDCMISLLQQCPLYDKNTEAPLDEYAKHRGHGVYGSVSEQSLLG